MTRYEKQLCVIIERSGACSKAAAQRLIERGLIDLRKVEAMAMRERIIEFQRQGARRCDAMQWTAEEFCCSYEKVRQCFYQKP